METPARDETQRFYSALLKGDVSRGLWGKEKRFDGVRIAAKRSVRQFFVEVVAEHLNREDVLLDLGCGPGGFLAASAPLVKRVVGVDITEEFVAAARQTIAHYQIPNADAVWSKDGTIPFGDASFDAVMMIDVIHHVEDIPRLLSEVHRVLKPNGRFLIFEPNKKNPALYLMCLMDRNERGLLSLGTVRRYRQAIEPRFAIKLAEANGLLVGPDSPAALTIANFLVKGRASRYLSWLSPKLFIVAQKVSSP